LFRFGARGITNRVVVVLMDNESYERLQQYRDQPWDRALHAKLLDRLAVDRCPLVIVDVFFLEPRDTNTDLALAKSMGCLPNVVLGAKLTGTEYQPDPAKPGANTAHPWTPIDLFLEAAKTNWGVAFLDRDVIVRRHWPFPSPGRYDSLPWTAAKLAGSKLEDKPQERWVRYYAPRSLTRLSYAFAETQPTNYFRDKIVFIGNQPESPRPDNEEDEFRTPYTRWTGDSVGGVEILATEFVNLVNGDWLRRPAWWIETLVLIATGLILGISIIRRRVFFACAVASGAALIALIAAVCLSYYTKYWFPWLVISGGQVPLALFVAVVTRERGPLPPTRTIVIHASTKDIHPVPAGVSGDYVLDVPDYELIQPPFGKGAYGRVWLARNAVRQWQAVKAVYRANFGEDVSPYEREFHGIERYKPVSDKHPGLMRIDFVSRMKPEGYFYYAMELGDAITPGWEQNPASYKPLDLAMLRTEKGGRLPALECVRLGAKLCEALHFLHSHGLAHRDIKPSNIIFVNGQPKLADVGLVADARRPEKEMSEYGTPGYMPPYPEPPGTPQADIYGLGMVLYVISTGGKPASFPELSTTIVDRNRHPEFSALSPVIFKACQPDRALRYATALEMQAALWEAEASLTRETAQPS
jgi:hypothetical protein